MKCSTRTTHSSCRIDEVFNHPNITAFAGLNMLVDFARQELELDKHLGSLSINKADHSRYLLSQEIEAQIYMRAAGLPRLNHFDEVEYDPLLPLKLGLDKLPSKSNLYRSLDRFDTPERVEELADVNKTVLDHLVGNEHLAILDIDTTVNTVHGEQEGASVGYNPRYRDRRSYQPLVAFEGHSGAAVYAQLRMGTSPTAEEKVDFYRQAKAQLPPGVKLGFVRADKAFASDTFFCALEEDGVHYARGCKSGF